MNFITEISLHTTVYSAIITGYYCKSYLIRQIQTRHQAAANPLTWAVKMPNYRLLLSIHTVLTMYT